MIHALHALLFDVAEEFAWLWIWKCNLYKGSHKNPCGLSCHDHLVLAKSSTSLDTFHRWNLFLLGHVYKWHGFYNPFCQRTFLNNTDRTHFSFFRVLEQCEHCTDSCWRNFAYSIHKRYFSLCHALVRCEFLGQNILFTNGAIFLFGLLWFLRAAFAFNCFFALCILRFVSFEMAMMRPTIVEISGTYFALKRLFPWMDYHVVV